MRNKAKKIKFSTNYDLFNEMLIYDDGRSKWNAKYYFNIPKKEFKLYNISKGTLTDEEIAVVLTEFLTYHYHIALKYLPNNDDLCVEYFKFLVNGYNVSKKGYDLITYYITEMPVTIPIEDNKTLKPLKEVFNHIIDNVEKLGKEEMLFKYKGNRIFFEIFLRDLIHIMESYEDFLEGTSVLFDYKIGFINHEFYILPNNEVEE